MTEEAENRSEDVCIPIPANEQRRKAISRPRTVLLGGVLVIVGAILVIVILLTLHNPGAGDDVVQVHLSVTFAQGPPSTSI